MTTVTYNIPNELAEQLERLGFLQDDRFAAQALFKELERYLAWERIQADFRALDAAGDPIPPEEIAAVVKEVRAESRPGGLS